MSKYSVEVSAVKSVVTKAGFSLSIASVVGEMLSTELGRREAYAVSAKKDGRTVSFGKADKDELADAKLTLKLAKLNTGYLPFRLLIISDAVTTFAKTTGIEAADVEYPLPEFVRLQLGELKGMADEREAKRLADVAAYDKAQAEKAARQALGEQLIAEHEKQLAAKAGKTEVAAK